MKVLILKTGALGDVLRTTSILPGLHRRYAGCEVVWVTARGAADLVQHHPRVARTELLDLGDPASFEALGEKLERESWGRILSFDDEQPLCDLATRLAAVSPEGALSGAYTDPAGRRVYTHDVSPWFDMGLLSVHGKAEADRLKAANVETHPAIFARMLEIDMGEPELPLPEKAHRFARNFAARHELHAVRPLIGLNTGAGGRWDSKKLPVERVGELVESLDQALGGKVTFLLLGGPEERERNDRILAQARGGARIVDGGTDNSLLDFAALVDSLDLLVTSDSLALHMAVAREVPVLAFFAPTPAEEIELYGRGSKVASTSPDYASYRSDADTSTLTTERLLEAALGLLAER